MKQFRRSLLLAAMLGLVTAGASAGDGKGTYDKACSVCHAKKSADDMVSFGNTWVCADCKPGYVQRLKEGVGASHGQVWRHKNRLVKPLDGPLPDCCAKCGASASGRPLKRTAWYCTPWVYLLLLINLLVVLIVYLVLRKRVNLEIPLCEDHRKQSSPARPKCLFSVHHHEDPEAARRAHGRRAA